MAAVTVQALAPDTATKCCGTPSAGLWLGTGGSKSDEARAWEVGVARR
jgi:hypothetical protein